MSESHSTPEATPAAAAAQDSHDEHHGVGHVVPTPLLFGVLLALLFLTALTVATARIDLDFFNIWLAMGIATVKATLVCAYFMHLRWDKPFNAIVVFSALGFLGLFLALSMMDTREYRSDLIGDFKVDGESPHQYLDEAPKKE